MDLLAAFRIYVRVAEARSFSAVARELGMTQPAVSRQVAALEEHLGSRLIQRTTRSLALSEDGRDLLGHARRLLDTVEEAESAVGRRHALPGGLVRLGSGASFGRLYIAPRMPRLLERYPEISIDLHMSDTVTDLVAEGIDLSIRTAEVQDSSLVARKIGSYRRVAVASAECIAKHGEPKHPSDLERLPCIVFTAAQAPNDWTFGRGDNAITVRVGGRFRTDNGEAVREAVLSGLGFALLPTWFLSQEITSGDLRPVLSDWQPPSSPITAVYPTRRNLAPRTRAVIDFLVDEYRLDPVISSYGEA